MLSFFKKLRLIVLTENKFTKYLLYAVGEIILVVIGILIALQVNNWNIRQIQNKKERAYIDEIRKSLIQDISTIDYIKVGNLKKDSCINLAIGLLGTKMDNSTRVLKFFDLIPTLGAYSAYQPNYVAFNNMISAESIDLIKNDSLRNSIANYYGREEFLLQKVQERMKEKTHQFLDLILPLLVNKEVSASLAGANLNFEYPSISEIEFQTNPYIFYELNMMKISNETQNQFLEISKQEIEHVLALISNVQ